MCAGDLSTTGAYDAYHSHGVVAGGSEGSAPHPYQGEARSGLPRSTRGTRGCAIGKPVTPMMNGTSWSSDHSLSAIWIGGG